MMSAIGWLLLALGAALGAAFGSLPLWPAIVCVLLSVWRFAAHTGQTYDPPAFAPPARREIPPL
jgi:hypothetical protein